MKKIMLTHSYFLRLDPKQWATAQPYAPLGTLYATAFMRQHKYNVSFFDVMFARQTGDILPFMAQMPPDIFVIYDDGFNYLTKMCLENMRLAAFEMIKAAKSQGCTVIVSSSDSTDRFELYLDQGADFILLGEAENTLLQLSNAISKNDINFAAIPGLAFKQNAAVVKTIRRPVLKDLDSLPFPAWDLIDMEPYRKMWQKSSGRFSINMATTRGCPFKCNWCAKPIYGNRYNCRSVRSVIEELKMLSERFSFDHVWFCDDIFGLKPGWIEEFANEVVGQKLDFTFKMQGRADLLLAEDNIRNLARAGCENIWMGAESGSQRILDAMDKGITVEQIYEATGLLKKCGIHPSFFIQFGYLTETKEDIVKTTAMINELLPYEIGISVSYPLPGTVFFEKVKQDLTLKTNWRDSDELALMFRNTYPAVFYKQLHRYVHKNYRKHIAFANIRQLITTPFKSSFMTFKRAFSALYYVPAAYIDQRKLFQLEKNADGLES